VFAGSKLIHWSVVFFQKKTQQSISPTVLVFLSLPPLLSQLLLQMQLHKLGGWTRYSAANCCCAHSW
jgi:hypothetical protein